MREFIKSKKEYIQEEYVQRCLALENVLRHIQDFSQSLIAEVAGKEGSEAVEHAVKGLLAIDDFVKKNIDTLVASKAQAQLLETMLATYDKNKRLVEEAANENKRKIRKIGEKPEGVRQVRNAVKNKELYRDTETVSEDTQRLWQ